MTTKASKITYWVATIWLALGMVSTGIVQLIKAPEEIDNFNSLGYPLYLMTIIGVWKILGTAAILTPKLKLIKEWAYAGFFFAMSGAVASHIIVGHDMSKVFPPTLLLVLTVLSWYFRPANRRLYEAK